MSKCTALVTKQVNKQIHALPVLLGPSVRIVNGPAKSTPVKLNAGSSFTLLTGKGGGGGVGNGDPSNLQQTTHRCIIAPTKLRSFAIQNFLLISVKVSRTPLCSTRSWASLIIRGVRGWFQDNRRGYFVEYGTSAFASQPPQHHRPFLSMNRLNWDLSESNDFSCSRSLWESWIHLHSASNSSSVESGLLLRLVPLLLNIFTALSTYAVTLTSLLKLLNLSHQMRSPIVRLTSVAVRLWVFLLLASNSWKQSSGISVGSVVSFNVRLSFNQSGLYRHKRFTSNSDIVIPLEGRSAGLVTPGQWCHRSGDVLLQISLTQF